MLLQNKKYNRNIINALKIPIIVCILASSVLCVFSYIITNSFENYAIKRNINELNALIYSIEREITFKNPDINHDEFIQDVLLIVVSHPHILLSISDKNNNVIYKTRGPNLLLVPREISMTDLLKNGTTAVWDYGKTSYRVAASTMIAGNNQPYTMIAAINRDFHLEFIERLHKGLLILIAITCPLIFLGTSISIYFSQKPINQLIKKISSINTKSLNVRIEPSSVSPKYASLTEAFNKMISRMDIVFQRQHNFTADLAHEMRTPITNLTTQTQIALNNARTIAEYQEILYSNLEEFERLSQIITDMLFLAQADNKQLIPKMANVNLHNLALFMLDYYEYLSEEKNITLKLEGDCPEIMGDKLMIGRAVSNLLSNAIRYTPAEKCITIFLSQVSNNFVKIVVSNPGKPIEDKHLPLIFDRFYRPDESRQRNGEGAGIGLAIVKSIVEAHSGNINVESDHNSTRFTMTLPIRNEHNKSA